MGVTSLGGSALSVGFIALGVFGLISNALRHVLGGGLEFSDPVLRDFSTRPSIAALVFFIGCISAVFVSYMPLVEFGTRSRPIAIDDGGVTNFLFGMRLRSLAWSHVRKIVKVRAQHPLGFKLEYVRIFGNASAVDSQRQGEAALPTLNTADAVRGWLKLMPRREFWLPSYVDHKSFPKACDMLSDYAQLHRIPMEFWDMTPAARRNARKQGKSQIVGLPVDHL